MKAIAIRQVKDQQRYSLLDQRLQEPQTERSL